MKSPTSRWHDGLLLAQLLGLLLLGLSYARIAGDSQSAAFRDKVLESLFAGPIWGTKTGYNLMWFALAVLVVHMLYATLCWALARLSARAWPNMKATLRQHVMLWFFFVTAAVLANNAATFIGSSLGEPYADTMSSRVFGVALGNLIFIGVVAAAALTLAMAALRWWRDGGRLSRRSGFTLGALGLVYVAVTAHSIMPAPGQTPSAKPNVILIGLDSMRNDLVDEKTSPNVTPHLAAFMKSATRFSNAMTPLARTFPSMCAMFTGRHPHRSGAVMNLLPRNLIDDAESLPRVLARAGYQTTYATDEVRFANIDTSFGFDKTITPPIGASEFLIEKLADTPVTNLMMNTRLGSWLFPFVHANRGASITYDPDVFVRRIARELEPRQPQFFTVHLTLNHWPYSWAGSPPKKKTGDKHWPPYYLNAAQRVDEQLGDVFEMLERKGLLKNAIVVVYSDHGEAFDAPHETLVPDADPLITSLGIVPTWGHGTSVLSPNQYGIVLGIRRYGEENWQAGRELAEPVSFEDIAPTVVETLGLQTSARFDGRSLLGLLEGRDGAGQNFAGRIRFTETEYQLPAGFATQDGKLSPSKVQDALTVYNVDRETDRITLKQDHVKRLLFQRQYAAIGQRHLVAAFPRKPGPGHDFLTVALAGSAPRQLFAEPGADEPEIRELWNALFREFGDVIHVDGQPVAASTVANR